MWLIMGPIIGYIKIVEWVHSILLMYQIDYKNLVADATQFWKM